MTISKLSPVSPTRSRRRSRSARRRSAKSSRLRGATVTESVCPYCAVGCGQLIYTKGGQAHRHRGQPATARSTRARSAPRAPTPSSSPSTRTASRTCSTARPTPTTGRRKPLDWAMDRIAQRVKDDARRRLHARRPRTGQLLNSVAQHRHARRGDARQRRELPDQEAVRRRAGRGLDREPGADMTLAPRCPVWAPRSAAARPPPTSRTSPTATASCSWARTWPRPTRRLPLADEGEGEGRDADPRRSALHAARRRCATSTSASAPAATSPSSAA